jgi:hypothetical protein
MVSCALVCFTKKDENYLDEYIAYYLKLGFSTIFFYDNNSNRYLLKRKENHQVKVVWMPGMGRQAYAYNHFLKTFKHSFDYVAFFDSDEFLVLKKHGSIGDFCLDRISSGAIGINWYMFGNNGHQTYQNDLVVRRFTKRDRSMHPLVKTIAKCSDIREMSIHNPKTLFRGSFLNCRGQTIQDHCNYDWDDSLAQLNHYCTKSTEEYRWKIDRGRAIGKKRNYNELAYVLDCNHVIDTYALDFFLEIPFQKEDLGIVFFISDLSQIDDIVCRPEDDEIRVYVYYETNTYAKSFVFQNMVLIPSIPKNEYQQHFLVHFRTQSTYVLFQEPNDRFMYGNESDKELTYDSILRFCREEMIHGAFELTTIETGKEDIRILARCLDLLEIHYYKIVKMGFGESFQKSEKLFWSQKIL